MNIRRALIVDTETTGLVPGTDRIIEIGAVLYSVEHQTPLTLWSTLIYAEENAAEHVNRIPVGALRQANGSSAFRSLASLADQADVICAHRAEFDRSFIARVAPELAASKPWVCTKFDVEWPLSKVGDGLVHVALAHGVPVVDAHRALTDCMLLSKLFEKMGAGLETMLVRALRPKVTVVALVPFEQKDLAKAASFQWMPDKKLWTRTMFAEDVAALPFKTRELSQPNTQGT